jgi:hypothetical protein
MKRTSLIVFAIVTGLVLTAPAGATQAEKPSRVLFTNVHVFDGKAEKRIMNANVLVEGNLIKQVSPAPISTKDATVIDGGRRLDLCPDCNVQRQTTPVGSGILSGYPVAEGLVDGARHARAAGADPEARGAGPG